MAYNITTIRAKIKALIATVTEVAFVYDQFELSPEGYPAVIFDISKNENGMLTDSENIRKITFTLYILCEIGVKGRAGARDLLDTVTQNLITVLEDKDNMSLTGSVDWIMPVLGPRDELSIGSGTAFSQKLDLDVMVSSSIL